MVDGEDDSALPLGNLQDFLDHYWKTQVSCTVCKLQELSLGTGAHGHQTWTRQDLYNARSCEAVTTNSEYLASNWSHSKTITNTVLEDLSYEPPFQLREFRLRSGRVSFRRLRSFISAHKQCLKELEFVDVDLYRGTWPIFIDAAVKQSGLGKVRLVDVLQDGKVTSFASGKEYQLNLQDCQSIRDKTLAARTEGTHDIDHESVGSEEDFDRWTEHE